MAKTSAQPVAPGLVPLDELTVRVLVDNVTDSLSTVPPGVINEVPTLLANGNLREAAGESRCCAEHGLSLVIRARVANISHTVVFDAGPEAYAITRNGPLLNVPFEDVGAVVLSHGHWDHAGGLVEVVRQSAAGRTGMVECHVNPGMFTERATKRPDGQVLPQKPLPTPTELAEAGALVVNDFDERRILADRFYLSGEIPRETAYEHGFAEQLKRAEDGHGWEPDPLIADERYLAAHVKGLGAMVFTACSHAGLINVLADSKRTFGEVPLYAVMGGFHLSGKRVEDTIADTIQDLRAFSLRRVIPAHCTGWRAVNALAKVYPDDVLVPSAVGRTFTFGAA